MEHRIMNGKLYKASFINLKYEIMEHRIMNEKLHKASEDSQKEEDKQCSCPRYLMGMYQGPRCGRVYIAIIIKFVIDLMISNILFLEMNGSRALKLDFSKTFELII